MHSNSLYINYLATHESISLIFWIAAYLMYIIRNKETEKNSYFTSYWIYIDYVTASLQLPQQLPSIFLENG